MKGWVYIVINRSLNGLVKVGFSTKDPVLRISDFNNAGLPYEHELVYCALVDNPYEIEQKVHSHLKTHKENKEWFKCSIVTALSAVREIATTIYHEDKSSLLQEILDVEQNDSHITLDKSNDSSLFRYTKFISNPSDKRCAYFYYEGCNNPVHINYKGQFLCKEHHALERTKRFSSLRNN